jgi:threonine/homoserine/homoserine lactone efflux protein
MRGFIINLMNPKSVVFAASVIVMIFPPDISLAAMMVVPVNHLLIEYIVYFAFAFVFSRAAVRRGYLRRRVIFNRAAAIIMAGLALRMAVGG